MLQTPGAAPVAEGLFSVVIDPGTDSSVRRLPALYFGPAQVFADRAEAMVARRLVEMVRSVAAAPEQPTYLVSACRYAGRDGLYTRDLFNRSAYRAKLSRHGMRFADDPFVRLDESGSLRTLDWGLIAPKFVVTGPPDEQHRGAVRTTGAMLTFLLAEHRLGPLTAGELNTLTAVLREAMGLGADDPDAIRAALEAPADA